MTILFMRIACWIPKATNTHSECVILIACPLQQWLLERASAFIVIETERVLYCVRSETEGTLEKRVNIVLDRHMPDTWLVPNGQPEILSVL
jgi:hypothetical protein